MCTRRKKRCHLFWILRGCHKFQCPGFKPIPFYFWLSSCSCVDLQPACWFSPPTHNSGSPWPSSADMAAHLESQCSIQSVLVWNWIQSCISATKINQINRKNYCKITIRVAQKYLCLFAFLCKMLKRVAKYTLAAINIPGWETLIRFNLPWQNNYLQQEFPFTSVFYDVGDQARGQANDERATFRLFRMWAQEVRSQNIVCKQGVAAVSCDASPTPDSLSQCFFGFGQAWGAGSP